MNSCALLGFLQSLMMAQPDGLEEPAQQWVAVGKGGAPRFATGPMTLKVTNNLVAGARGRVRIYVAR